MGRYERIGKAEFSSFRKVIDGAKVRYKPLLDAEHGVVMQIGTIPGEQMRRDRLEPLGADDEMDVRRTVRMTAERFKQLTDGAVVGNWVVPGLS